MLLYLYRLPFHTDGRIIFSSNQKTPNEFWSALLVNKFLIIFLRKKGLVWE
jgi:hypothetical protein